MKIHRNGSGVVSAIKTEAPKKPGVYLFYDRNGELLYIGKSVNLRNRMLSYFNRAPDTLESRTRRMVHSVRGFEYRVAETELIALLLEDELIKTYQPHYNVRQKEFLEYRYVLLTNDLYPTCKIVDHSADHMDGRVFGPFRDRYFADELLDLIHRHLRLRSCRDPVPAKKSMNYEIGLCCGPCRHKISHEDYASIVEHVVAFLSGDETHMLSVLESAMTEAADARQYDKAARLKNDIRFCRSFCQRQRFFHRFKTRTVVVRVNADADYEHKFVKGKLVSPIKSAPGDAIELVGPGGEEWLSGNDPRILLDRANVVYRWLNKKERGRDSHTQKVTPPRSRGRRGRGARV